MTRLEESLCCRLTGASILLLCCFYLSACGDHSGGSSEPGYFMFATKSAQYVPTDSWQGELVLRPLSQQLTRLDPVSLDPAEDLSFAQLAESIWNYHYTSEESIAVIIQVENDTVHFMNLKVINPRYDGQNELRLSAKWIGNDVQAYEMEEPFELDYALVFFLDSFPAQVLKLNTLPTSRSASGSALQKVDSQKSALLAIATLAELLDKAGTNLRQRTAQVNWDTTTASALDRVTQYVNSLRPGVDRPMALFGMCLQLAVCMNLKTDPNTPISQERRQMLLDRFREEDRNLSYMLSEDLKWLQLAASEHATLSQQMADAVSALARAGQEPPAI